jgi:sulfur carrier protein
MTQDPDPMGSPHPDPAGAVRIVLNGEPVDAPPDSTVAALVAGLTAATTGIAVALNGTVVPRGRWERMSVAPGDSVEVVTAVQGG